jgi:predicted phage terminase large subunit-like protein
MEVMQEAISKDWIRKSLINTKIYCDPWYKPAPIHEAVADFLSNDKIKRGVLVMPTQFGKTTLSMQTFPAWYLANNPNKNIIAVSYNETFANKQSVICRDFFMSKEFQELFPWLKLHPDSTTKHEWRLTGRHRGGIIFAGKGTGVSGNPADVLIIDDLYKDYEAAMSKLQQEKDFNWFDRVCLKRLQGESSRVIIVGSRMVKNDLVGRLQEQERKQNTPQEKRYVVLNLPAIINCKKEGDLTTGESAWKDKKSLQFLLDDYNKNPSVFMSMMMGNPIDTASQLLKESNFKIINFSQLKEYGKLLYSVRGWDFGYTEGGNWTAGAKINVYENNKPVIVDVIRWQAKTNITVQRIKEVALNDGASVIIGLESGGTQIAMADRIKNERELFNFNFVTRIPKKDKMQRAMPWILKAQDGMLPLLEGKWNRDFVSEGVAFSENCEVDDQIDAVSTSWEILYGTRGNASDSNEDEQQKQAA